MSQAPIWFDRKFESSFPVEMLPNLCARLRGTPARLEEVLRGRSHTILIGKAQVKWSAQENVSHLLVRALVVTCACAGIANESPPELFSGPIGP